MILDIHTHSYYSDGLNSPKTMAKQAKKVGLGGFALVDHDTVLGLKEAKQAADELGLVLVPGLEVSCLEGHVVALGVEEVIEKGPAVEVIEKIKDLGGISIAVHPYDIFRKGVGSLIEKLHFDYIETFNSRTVLTFLNRKAEKVADKLNLKKVCGSDAHWFTEVGLSSIKVNSIEDLYRGRAQIHRQKWAGLRQIAVEKTKRTFKKLV